MRLWGTLFSQCETMEDFETTDRLRTSHFESLARFILSQRQPSSHLTGGKVFKSKAEINQALTMATFYSFEMSFYGDVNA